MTTAPTHPPITRLRIGPYDYAVNWYQEPPEGIDADGYGYNNHETREIGLSITLVNPTDLMRVLIFQVFECLFEVYNIMLIEVISEKESREERDKELEAAEADAIDSMNQFAQAWICFMRDNIEVVLWMLSQTEARS